MPGAIYFRGGCMMNAIEKLNILDRREAEVLKDLTEIREQRREVIREMEQQSINFKLTREDVSGLLGYNYYYLSRLKLPFRNGKIFYLTLADWVEQNKPGRLKRLESNYKKFLDGRRY